MLALLTAEPLAFSAADVPAATNTPLRAITFVAFDTETTGVASGRDRIVELAGLKFRDGRVLDRQSWLINPGIPIPPFAQGIHGITDAMVSNSPPFADVFPSFARFSEGCVLLGHNVRFDRQFLAAEAERNGLELPGVLFLDSLPMFKAWYPRQPSYALSSLTAALMPHCTNLPPAATSDRTNRFHAAGWDSDCLMALFVRGMTNLPPHATLGDLLRVTGGAYSFQSPRRSWRPTPVGTNHSSSSSDAAPDALAP